MSDELTTRTPRRLAATNLAAQGGALLCVSVASLLVARAGGAAVLGDYALLRVLPWLVGVVLSCGLPTASAYFLASDHRHDGRLRPTLAAIAVVGAGLGAVLWLGLSIPLRDLFFKTTPVHLVAVMAVVVVTQLATVTAKACCQGSGDLKGANLIIVAEEFWFVPVYLAVLHLHGHGISAVVISLLLSGGLATATGLIRLVQQGFFRSWGIPSAALARQVASYGARGQLGNLLWLMNLRFDFLLLGALAGPTVLGIYAVASKFAELMRLVPTAINYVLYPRFARVGDKEAVADARRLLPQATALTLVLTPVLAVVSAIALPILYGAQFRGAVLPAEIILIGLSVEGAAAVTSAFLLGIRRPGLNSWGMAAGVVVTLSLDLLLIPRYGARGGAITSAVAYLTTTCVLYLIFRRQAARIVAQSDDGEAQDELVLVGSTTASRSQALIQDEPIWRSTNGHTAMRSLRGGLDHLGDYPTDQSGPGQPTRSIAVTTPKRWGPDRPTRSRPASTGGGRPKVVPSDDASADASTDTPAPAAFSPRAAGEVPGVGGLPSRPGELCYLVDSATQRPGASRTRTPKVQVRLALAAAEDGEVLRSRGLAAMRQARVARLIDQAEAQGGRLTVEDLALLTCAAPETIAGDLMMESSAPETVEHDVVVTSSARKAAPETVEHDVMVTSSARNKREPTVSTDAEPPPPARPPVEDIRPGLSRRAEAVQLYLSGLEISDIMSRTYHPEGSIRRYLAEFRQVAALHAGGAQMREIRAATGRPEALISEYTGLYEQARREFPAAPRLHELLDLELATTRRWGRR